MFGLQTLQKLPLAAAVALSALAMSSFGLHAAADAQTDREGQVLDLRPEDAADVCNAETAQIRTTVNGVQGYGILLVEVYGDDADNFLSREGRLRRVRVAAEDGPQTVCINIEGPGTYAVASYHDQDADRKLDKRWNRLPKEPFALSNDPKLKLRKPRLYEAAFEAGELGADITVNLRGTR